MRYQFEPVTYKTFGACIAVQRQLGPYSREIDCQRALEIELPKQGLEFLREAEIPILYDGIEITRRRVDFVIWDNAHTIEPWSTKPRSDAKDAKREDREGLTPATLCFDMNCYCGRLHVLWAFRPQTCIEHRFVS